MPVFNARARNLRWSPGPDYYDAGKYHAKFIVEDRRDRNDPEIGRDSETVEITVTNRNRHPNVDCTVASGTGVIRNSNVNFEVKVSDPDSDDQLTVTVSTKPAGSTFDHVAGDPATWIFDWTPDDNTALGDHSLEFTVSDGEDTRRRRFMIDVKTSNTAPEITLTGAEITAEDEMILNEEETYVIRIKAEDADGDRMTYGISNKPKNADFNISTGSMTWMPESNRVGSHTDVTFEASDGILSGTKTVSFVVKEVTPNQPPVISVGRRGGRSGYEYTPFVGGYAAIDPDGDNLEITVDIPANMKADGVYYEITDNSPGRIDFSIKWDNPKKGTYRGHKDEVGDKLINVTATDDGVNADGSPNRLTGEGSAPFGIAEAGIILDPLMVSKITVTEGESVRATVHAKSYYRAITYGAELTMNGRDIDTSRYISSSGVFNWPATEEGTGTLVLSASDKPGARIRTGHFGEIKITVNGIPGKIKGDFISKGSAGLIRDIGDVNGDGVTDLASLYVSETVKWAYYRRVYAGGISVRFMNKDHTLKGGHTISDETRTFPGTASDGEYLSYNDFDSIGDLNGDGTPDLVVPVFKPGSRKALDSAYIMILFLDPDGKVIDHRVIEEAGRIAAARKVKNIGDVDDNGTDDLYISSFVYAANRHGDFIYCMNSDGSVKEIRDPGSLEYDSCRVDLDGDGVQDIVKSKSTQITVGGKRDKKASYPKTWIEISFMNADGSVRETQVISKEEGGFSATLDPKEYISYPVASVGDLNGDGVQDLAVGTWKTTITSSPLSWGIHGPDGKNYQANGSRNSMFILYMNTDGTVKSEQRVHVKPDSGITVVEGIDENGLPETVIYWF